MLHKNPSGVTSFAWWTAQTNSGDFYPAGQRWTFGTSGWVTFPTDFPDFGFQTYVEPDMTADVDVLLDAMRNEMGFTGDSALRSPGVRAAYLSRLDDIDVMIDAGLLDDAAAELQNLRRRFDGCGSVPDVNDWVTDCTVQQELQALLDSLVVLLTP